MEKNTKSPDSVKSDNPQSPSAASIDKLGKESEKNNVSARNKNSESHSSKQRPLPESQEIDKQISELSCMIRRLQDEIVELSRNAAKDDDKNTQTFNIMEKTDRSSGSNDFGVDNTTLIVGTAQTQPSLKDSSVIDAKELPEGIKNVGSNDKAQFDDLDYTLMNVSQVASETKPDPLYNPQADNNAYNKLYQLNMENVADENEEDNLDMDGNENDEYPNDENEHSSEFDFGSDIGDTTVVGNNDDDVDDTES